MRSMLLCARLYALIRAEGEQEEPGAFGSDAGFGGKCLKTRFSLDEPARMRYNDFSVVLPVLLVLHQYFIGLSATP